MESAYTTQAGGATNNGAIPLAGSAAKGTGDTQTPPLFNLTPRRILIEAPHMLVWEMITAVGQGQLPGSESTARLVERKSDTVLIAEFVTRSGDKTYTTLEEMTLYPPDRITYSHLNGPLPYVWEEIKLRPDGANHTLLLYKGEFRTKSVLGYLLGPLYIRPRFDKLVLEHLGEIKRAAEARAQRSIKYRAQ